MSVLCVQSHLTRDARQRPHQEVGRAHPSLDGSERMLDRLATGAWLAGVLYPTQQILVPHLAMRRSGPMHCDLSAHLEHAVVQ